MHEADAMLAVAICGIGDTSSLQSTRASIHHSVLLQYQKRLLFSEDGFRTLTLEDTEMLRPDEKGETAPRHVLGYSRSA